MGTHDDSILVLFVGGPEDGLLRHVRPTSDNRVWVHLSRREAKPYDIQAVRGLRNTFYIGLFDGMQIDDALATIFKFYSESMTSVVDGPDGPMPNWRTGQGW